MRRLLFIFFFVASMCAAAVVADEGMWTVNNFPKADLAKKYSVQIDDEWLDRLQKAVVRLETGCTGSFVSPDGLILTNHHCAASCLAENSTAARDLLKNGYAAPTRNDEVRCQGEQASVLMETQEVTPEVTRALAGVEAADAAKVRNEALTKLEERCEADSKQAGTPLKCETVTLYQGGQYWLYKYKRYDDVRLAFAPEDAIAAFGGDPDNFQFPRWCLDMSLLRAYENGKPASIPGHLSFNWDGAKDGEPVFVAGHPGTTQRLMTAAQLRTQRDLFLPFWLLRFSELRGRLIQYSKTSPEAARTAKDYLDTIENSIKVRRMQLHSLLNDPVIEQHAGDEQKLRAAIETSDGSKGAGTPWDDISRAEARYRDILVPYTWIEGGAAFNSELFVYARELVRAADEREKPNADRLREYTDAQLPQLRQSLAAATPVYPAFERVRLSFSLERMREYLGPDSEVVKVALGNATPDERARTLVMGSTLGDPKVRIALSEGGQKALSANKDPMIALARAVDEEARRLRKIYENEVQVPEQRAQQAIADARFKVYGTSLYPDATFTLRVTYGAVQGWTEPDGERVEPFTRLSRLYERATGAWPFALPQRWMTAKPRLEMNTLVNFTTNNDIVGGNSGSPVVNAKGEIVGLAFDGNVHSISGSYWFDVEKNRTVAVHPAYIETAIGQVYKVPGIAKELGISEGARKVARGSLP